MDLRMNVGKGRFEPCTRALCVCVVCDTQRETECVHCQLRLFKDLECTRGPWNVIVIYLHQWGFKCHIYKGKAGRLEFSHL